MGEIDLPLQKSYELINVNNSNAHIGAEKICIYTNLLKNQRKANSRMANPNTLPRMNPIKALCPRTPLGSMMRIGLTGTIGDRGGDGTGGEGGGGV